MKWVALMPLRGGSKSIPGKNLRVIAGKPLFQWSLDAAVESGCFDRIFVSTDSPEIRSEVLRVMGDRVVVLDRAPELAQDHSSTEAVMLDFQKRVPFDVLCLIQATSPLTHSEDFRAAKEMFLTKGCDSLFTGVSSKRFFWKNGAPLNYDPSKRPRRQEMEGWVMENGAFYFTRATVLEASLSRLGGNIGCHLMTEESGIELDEPSDWTAVEALLLQRRRQDIAKRLKEIRGLVLDVDGTLTDGGMYYGLEGEMFKRFDTRDAKGLERVRQERGIFVAVITAEDSPAVTARMKKLGIPKYFKGVKDKLPVLRQIAADFGISTQELAYMGDDLGDMECLKEAGFACCPGDAVVAVKNVVDHITSAGGGRGAVRELCELLLEEQ